MSHEPLDPQLEPLPKKLLEILEREKQGYSEDAQRMANVLASVEMAVALQGPVVGSGAAQSGTTGSASSAVGTAGLKALGLKTVAGIGVAAFVTGAFAGGSVVTSLAKNSMERANIPAASAVAAASIPYASSSPNVAPAAASEEPIPFANLPPASPLTHGPSLSNIAASASNSRAQGDLAKERELLDVARAALARSRPEDAIAFAERHAQKWPHGFLGEEREVVLIQALVAAGRRDEAGRMAATFRKNFPASMLMPAVDAVLGTSPASSR